MLPRLGIWGVRGGSVRRGWLAVRERLAARLAELEVEKVRGLQLLGEQEAQLAATRATLLRLDGAASVLRELLVDAVEPQG